MSLRRRPIRLSIILAITTGLLLSSLITPALGKLANVTVTATAVPGSVTPGANVAIDVEFYNFPSMSNISQLYLTAAAPPNGWILDGVEGQSQGDPCVVGTATFSCSLGAVPAGSTATVRVVYITPSTGSGSVSLNWFLFNTTGVAGDRKGNSHGDDYMTTGTVTLDPSSDFAGAYTSSDNLTVADNPVLHVRRNPQSTSVTSPTGLIGVTVGEVPGGTFSCPAVASTCFGQWSVISVNDGAPYPDGFSVVLGYKGNIGNASFVHLFDSYDSVTNPTAYETIAHPGDLCSSSTPSASEIPCMILSSSGGESFATLWLNRNGQVKAY
ncbi:MAG: hypothetical protein WD402_01555 [Chloroflexota bacterium]